jgi:hypothetical protein
MRSTFCSGLSTVMPSSPSSEEPGTVGSGVWAGVGRAPVVDGSACCSFSDFVDFSDLDDSNDVWLGKDLDDFNDV